MKPSKRGRERTTISLPPFPDSEWPGAPTNTLSPGQGWLRQAGGPLGLSERDSLTPQTQARDGSLPVVDRIVEPFPPGEAPWSVAFWSFRCLAESALEPPRPSPWCLSRLLHR